MKLLMTLVTVLFSVNAMAFGNPANFPSLSGLDKAKEIQAEKSLIAAKAAMNTYPEQFDANTTAYFGWLKTNYTYVVVSGNGCTMNVKVRDNGQVVKKSAITCN